MGANHCSCERDNTGDDFFYQIFDSLNLKKLDVRYVYKEFTACVSENKQSRKGTSTAKLNEKRFYNFLSKIVSAHEHQIAQTEYFKTVIHLSGYGTDAIKRLGAFLILNSDGSYIDKLAILKEHVSKYYGNKERRLKEFVYDVVLLNTEICLIAFENYLEKEAYERFRIIWKKQRIEKYILNTFNKYESEYANSTRNSYYKNVELPGEKNTNQINTPNGVLDVNTLEKGMNSSEKNVSKPINGVNVTNFLEMNKNNTLKNISTNAFDVNTNFERGENIGNNQECFNRYLNYFLFDLQGDNIRTGIHQIFLVDSSGAISLKKTSRN
jgi:hypothetical protein